MVLVFIGLLSTVQELGFGQAVVHFDEGSLNLATLFGATIVIGGLSTILLFALSPLISSFYHESRLTPVLHVLSLTLLLTGIQSVPNSLLAKTFRFKALAIRDSLPTFAAAGIALVMAYKGFGVWSLVTNMVLSAGLQTVLAIWMVPIKLSVRVDRKALKRALDYGLPLMSAILIQQICDNADYLVVGKMMGATALGYYALAFRLATLAHEKIGVIVNRIAFPSFAAMQGDHISVVEHWLSVSRAISFLNFPLLSFLFLNARDLILLLFGEKWMPVISPLRYLCVVGILRGLLTVTLHLLNALGHTKATLLLSAAGLVLLPGSFIVGCALGGITGVGIAWCVAYPILLVIVLLKVKTLIDFSLLDYITNLRQPGFIAAGILIVTGPLGWLSFTPLWRLCLRGIVSAVICLVWASTYPAVRRRFSVLRPARLLRV